jgi:hypothetical protein
VSTAIPTKEAEEGERSGCLNCGTPLVGKHCHECGQQAHVHRSLSAFWHDLLHGVLHFEGKIWRTLPLLAWRPGELTRRYVEGERARFVSPMALFLFSVFLMFAVFSITGGSSFFSDNRTQTNFKENLSRSVGQAEQAVKDLEEERAAAVLEGGDIAAIDAQLKSARNEAKILRSMNEKGVAETTLARSSDGFQSNFGWLNRAYEKAKANPSLLFYKLQANAYKFSWALIPISVPLVWLLFLHRRRYRQYKVYDHTVFVTYSIAFVSLGAVILVLARMIGFGQPGMALTVLLVPPVHMYRQLRGAYVLSRWSAVWRTFALLFFAVIASSIFFLLLLGLGVLG